jgi:biopolymer transport protein ExbB
MWEWIKETYIGGGPVMHPILLCSLLGTAIIVERFRVLSSATKVKKDELMQHINAHIMQGNIDKAISVASQIRSPLTNIVSAGLIAAANRKSDEEVQTAMDAVALREIPLLERRIPLLSTISNMSTLLGLLGTMGGMISAFKGVANVAPSEKAAMLSFAIGESMITTSFGLIVAIPILAAYAWVSGWANDVVDSIHETSVRTLNFILSNRDKLR